MFESEDTMALPMMHLCIAFKIAEKTRIYNDDPLYFLGSISPDAIHMRENTSGTDKKITHLSQRGLKDIENPFDVFVKDYMNTPNQLNAFDLGYLIHIATDIIWTSNIYNKFCTIYDDNNMKPIDKAERRSCFYNETDQFDLQLYNNASYRKEIWKLLESAKPHNASKLLSDNEINLWNQHILKWYNNFDHKKYTPIKYLNIDMINDFINIASNKIIKIIENT